MKIPKKILSYFLLLCGCAGSQPKVWGDGFPDVWWQELPKDQAASWEITPQSANRAKGEVILSKRNELGKFSNFEASPFTLDGVQYASLEGLWQSMKYPEDKNDERTRDKSIEWPYTREQVTKLAAFEAKHAGDVASENMKKLGIKWVTYKGERMDYVGGNPQKHYDLIERATRAKLAAHPEIKELLLKTKNLKLLPDHEQKADSPPSYRYFDIYMKIRSELQNQKG